MDYILDAYNIIHYIGMEGNSAYEVQRRFIGFLMRHRLFSSGKNRAVVVFDGFLSESLSCSGNIEIVFSRDISADEKIERLLKRRVKSFVVSNDRQVKASAKAFGHVPMPVVEFLSISRRAKEQQTDKDDMSKRLLKKDIEDINSELEKIWLKKES